MQLKDIGKDYYLYQFTNAELFEVLIKRDEWSDLDVSLAEQLLKSRGQKVDKTEMTRKREEWLEGLRQPDPLPAFWLVGGYLVGILGGFVGVLVGHAIVNSKKTLPDGTKIFRYSERDRGHGKLIRVSGVFLVMVLVLCAILFTE